MTGKIESFCCDIENINNINGQMLLIKLMTLIWGRLFLNRSYRYFLMVARMGSIKNASERLHLTQPTLTTAIKNLEEKIGVPLLIRRSKGVELTEYGRIFQKYVEEQQSKHVDLLHRLQDMQQREMGKLKLGVGEAWWEIFVRDAIKEYQAKYPASSLYMEFGNNLSLMQHLVQGDIDLFVGHEIQGLKERFQVTFLPLLQDLEAYYVAENHPLLGNLEDVSQLSAFPVIKVTPGHARYSSVVTDSINYFDNDSSRAEGNKVIYELDSLLAGIDMLKMTDAVMPYTNKVALWMEQRGGKLLHVDSNKVGNVGIYFKRSFEDEKAHYLMDMMQIVLSTRY